MTERVDIYVIVTQPNCTGKLRFIISSKYEGRGGAITKGWSKHLPGRWKSKGMFVLFANIKFVGFLLSKQEFYFILYAKTKVRKCFFFF